MIAFGVAVFFWSVIALWLATRLAPAVGTAAAWLCRMLIWAMAIACVVVLAPFQMIEAACASAYRRRRPTAINLSGVHMLRPQGTTSGRKIRPSAWSSGR
jgi:methylthioribose-1-phosphate isomerase